MICPATSPVRITQNNSKGRPKAWMATPDPISIRIPAPNMPVRSVQRRRPMSAPSFVLTRKVPRIEAMMPMAATRIGRVYMLSPYSALTSLMSPSPKKVAPVAARATVAIIEPTYDSNRSAPIPATSPTLSPTLSATVAGLRGSSSGIPASTLPTRSAPTSAALVYMPPPTLANRAMDDAPNPNPRDYADVSERSGIWPSCQSARCSRPRRP